MKEVVARADHAGYGVGSFNVVSMQTIMGAIKAAEDANSPIILQAAEVRLKHSPLNLLGPMMVEAARKAKVPVAVHLDHGSQLEIIKQALAMGFTSVMYDGSHLPLEENIKKTREVIKLAKEYGASTEGEIGRVGGSEDSSEDIEMVITQVKDASSFFQHTGVDTLAVAIGNVHGIYKSEPKLQFQRLMEIKQAVGIPLVLHGGSGLTNSDFRRCISCGIKKINVQTATLTNVVRKVRSLLSETKEVDYFTYHQCVIDAAYESVGSHIEAFQSGNQA
jgi:fructose-bisphosphate aldolase class II